MGGRHVITAFLNLAGIGFIYWLLFNLAVYARPFFAGMSAGMAATGVGPIDAIVTGLFIGVPTLIAGQVLFAWCARQRCGGSSQSCSPPRPRSLGTTLCMARPALAIRPRSGDRR